MKKENKTLITIAAVAAGALLLTKSKGVNGIGDTDEKILAAAEDMDIWVMNVEPLYHRYMNEISRFMFKDGRGRYGAKQRVKEMLKEDYARGKFDRSSWRRYNDESRSIAADRIIDYYINS